MLWIDKCTSLKDTPLWIAQWGWGGGGVRVRSHVCCKGVGSLVFIWQASEGKVILYCGLFNIWWDTSLTCLQCNLTFMPWCSLCVSSVGTAEESVGELCCQLGFITGAHTRKSSFSHRRAKWFYAQNSARMFPVDSNSGALWIYTENILL